MAATDMEFQLFSSLRFDPLLAQSTINSWLNNGPSPFYMLPFHRDRILQAANHFKWPLAVAAIAGPEGLVHLEQKLKSCIDVSSTTSLRVKILLDHKGELVVEMNQTPTVPMGNLYPSRIPPPKSMMMEISPPTGGELLIGAGGFVIDGNGHGEPERNQQWIVMADPQRTKPSSFTSYKTTSRNMYEGARTRVGIENMTDPREVLIISTDGDEIMEGSLTTVLLWRNGRWVTPPGSSGGQLGTTRRWLLEKGLCEEEAVSSTSLVDGEECWVSNGVRGLIWGQVKL